MVATIVIPEHFGVGLIVSLGRAPEELVTYDPDRDSASE